MLLSLTPGIEFRLPSGADPNEFTAEAHQHMIFLHAVTCPGTQPCKQPTLEIIHFYGEGDTPLGKFLLDACLAPPIVCNNQKCSRPPTSHVRSYTYDRTKLTLTILTTQDLVLVLRCIF